jgi:phospholipid transport system substrate-binding protein
MKKATHLIGTFLLLAAVARAGVPTDQIRQTTDEILKAVQQNRGEREGVVEERRTRIREIVGRRFDWENMARRSLGRYWRSGNDSQQTEFVDLFSQLLENTYLEKVEGYSGEKVMYEMERIDGLYARVFVKILTNTGKEVSVEYRVKDNDGNWLVYDVVIEGVSLVKNYRSQFNSLMSRGDFDDMLEKLRKKIDGIDR